MRRPRNVPPLRVSARRWLRPQGADPPREHAALSPPTCARRVRGLNKHRQQSARAPTRLVLMLWMDKCGRCSSDEQGKNQQTDKSTRQRGSPQTARSPSGHVRVRSDSSCLAVPVDSTAHGAQLPNETLRTCCEVSPRAGGDRGRVPTPRRPTLCLGAQMRPSGQTVSRPLARGSACRTANQTLWVSVFLSVKRGQCSSLPHRASQSHGVIHS